MIKNSNSLVKIILIVVIVLFVGVVFMFINAFAGNPFSKSIAKNKVQKYIHDVYSADSFVEKTSWSAKNGYYIVRSEEHTSELQSRPHLVCRLLLEKKKKKKIITQ